MEEGERTHYEELLVLVVLALHLESEKKLDPDWNETFDETSQKLKDAIDDIHSKCDVSGRKNFFDF